jgi:hypothetical protein
MNHQECLVKKMGPCGHACGLRAEEILTRQNPIVAEVQEHAPVGVPSCCASTGEVAVQRRALEEVLDSGFGMQEEDCPLGHLLPAVLKIPPPPLIW